MQGFLRSILILIFLVGFFVVPKRAEALEPKLLWEKKLPFEIFHIKLAKESGDIILSSKKGRQIILYDKNGKERFHWGPRIDRLPFNVDISADGNRIVYATSWTDDHVEKNKIDVEKYGWDTRVHYSTKTGKELWSKKIEGGVPFLSPDGALIAVGISEGEGGGLTVFNSTGNLLWRYSSRAVDNLQFSPDNYILFSDGEMHLIDASGKLFWKKNDNGLSISEGANFITSRSEEKIYDKQGNIIFNGYAIVSADGNKLVQISPSNIYILGLPDKTIQREFAISAKNIDLSYDGRFIVATGIRSGSTSNLFVLDCVNGVLWESRIEGQELGVLEGQDTGISITKDGKYVMLTVDGKKLLFYQIY